MEEDDVKAWLIVSSVFVVCCPIAVPWFCYSYFCDDEEEDKDEPGEEGQGMTNQSNAQSELPNATEGEGGESQNGFQEEPPRPRALFDPASDEPSTSLSSYSSRQPPANPYPYPTAPAPEPISQQPTADSSYLVQPNPSFLANLPPPSYVEAVADDRREQV